MSDIEELEKKSNAGDAEAMFQLGVAYAFGNEVDISLDKTLFWLKNAAQVGHSTAAIVLKEVGLMPSALGDNHTEEGLVKSRDMVRMSDALSNKSNSTGDVSATSIKSETKSAEFVGSLGIFRTLGYWLSGGIIS